MLVFTLFDASGEGCTAALLRGEIVQVCVEPPSNHHADCFEQPDWRDFLYQGYVQVEDVMGRTEWVEARLIDYDDGLGLIKMPWMDADWLPVRLGHKIQDIAYDRDGVLRVEYVSKVFSIQLPPARRTGDLPDRVLVSSATAFPLVFYVIACWSGAEGPICPDIFRVEAKWNNIVWQEPTLTPVTSAWAKSPYIHFRTSRNQQNGTSTETVYRIDARNGRTEPLNSPCDANGDLGLLPTHPRLLKGRSDRCQEATSFCDLSCHKASSILDRVSKRL